ncbi:uncharacterized protein MKK02DRAFT_44273 [Dioszegia hungarica]|uniref:Stress response protein NST1 n=1 Tax=Dioszegia hungarica TaxID=4972 RepID=A0AA38H896_9TREE|nr:uncharacterized protein MKK02DRAFT_44273 [Dioszegia hungarica]KAI9635583.1 hypothetical protein MKK02DRAFT_44273 [Dioszegia hungarica]
MSGQPPSNVQPGLSKSAAKKKAKKAAAKAASSTAYPAASSTGPAGLAGGDAAYLTGEVPLTLDPHLYPAHSNYHPSATGFHASLPPLDPALFNFPPGAFPQGAYPVDVQYETATYYDDVEVPLPNANGTGPFSLPFPLDYNSLSAFGQPNGNSLSTLASNLNITHEDLVEVANELYRRMQEPSFGQDDPYWSNLSPHVRHFIREAVPYDTQTAAAARNQQTGSLEQRMMQAMAQKIVSAASEGMGIPKNLSANILAGVGVGVNGRAVFQGHPPPPPQPPTAASVAEQLGFRRHPDAQEEEDYEDEFDLDDGEYAAGANGDPPKKKNKKKKKRAAVQEVPPVQVPPPAAKQPPRPPSAPLQQPVLNPPPPPATPAPAPALAPAHSAHPTPSSRAAGKQPMPTAATGAPAAHPPSAATTAPARSARAAGKAPASSAPPANHHGHNHPHPPAKPAAKGKAPAPAPPAKIWTQSSAQDRENIRRFWLELNEAERRDLLQIEKDAVLRKMKEQHRHACGCAVCGRKKVNIEMELDQLYEQYYDELRLYAAEQRAASVGHRAQPPGAGPFPGSVEVDATGTVTKFDHRAPEHAYYQDDGLEDEGSELEEEYDGEDDEELDDEDLGSDEAEAGDDIDEPPPARAIRKPPARAAAPRAEGAEDFLAFGNSLATIKGGILTVADDLLKNDGARFLEMMEQLAVARVVREEQNVRDMQEETDDEDYDEAEEPLTEEQKMEEGRRMFQIFAARMFEQRVLQAYREKVAKQREEQLLLELEQEENVKKNKEERKAKEAQKKKDKKRMQKEKADKDKADRDAAQAEEIAAARLKAEEAERERLKRTEEERIRREAVKKAASEEAARQAAERKRRQQEEKEREEEAARKKKEKEDKARKEREARDKELKEKERKEKEERAAKEKADKAERDRLAKEKAEKERLAKEAREAAEKERLAKVEAERQEKVRRDEIARKERDAAELAKALAAQQAARVKAEKAAADKAAADKAAREKLAASTSAAPIPIKPRAASSRNGPTHTTPPAEQLSPIKSVGGSRPPAGPSTGRTPQKTPQAYFPQPMPAGSYPTRMPMGPGFGGTPGFRPSAPSGSFNPSVSPVFSPVVPLSGTSLSPNPPVRGFHPEPSPPFDHPRSAAIGMGFPMKPPGLAGPSHRLSSMEENYSETPIGAPRSVSTGDVNHLNLSGLTLEDYRPSAAIGAPGSAALGVGSAPGSAIGRTQPASLASTSASVSTNPTSAPLASGSRSPKGPERILGSAALLSTDDEIVSPPTRRSIHVNGWEAASMLPSLPPAPSGASRWSAGSSIWGASVAESPWSAPPPSSMSGPPGLPGLPSLHNQLPQHPHQLPHSLGPGPGGLRQPSGAGAGGSGPTSAPTASSFGGLGGGFGGAFAGGLFSPPVTAGPVPPGAGAGVGQTGKESQAQQIPGQTQQGGGQPGFGGFGMSQDKYHHH